MKQWKCKYCNYNTYDKSDYNKHLKTNKHMNNVKLQSNVKNKKLYCQFCNYSTTVKYNMNVHTHRMHSNDNSSNESLSSDKKYQLLEEKYFKLEKQNQELLETVKNQSATVKNQSITVKNTTETTKKTIDAVSMLNSKYPDAPPIGLLKQVTSASTTKKIYAKMNNIHESKHSQEEIIIYHYKEDSLVELLGDIIINTYKTEDSKNQSIWNSDISRLTFIIKNLQNDMKNSIWTKDCKGVQVKNIIIKPMLNTIKNKMKKYISKTSSYIDKMSLKTDISNDEITELDMLTKKSAFALDLIKTIALGKIHDNIIKYIAPYFGINNDK